MSAEIIQANNGNGAVMQLPKYDIQPVYSIQQAIERRQQMVSFVREIMVDGTDFGSIPGTGKGDEPGKSTLLKPGAEKLLSFFGLSVTLTCEKIEDWDGSDHGGEPLFSYTYRACAFRGTLLIAQADGNANSRESKYRWRWVNESDVPPGLNKDRLVKRGGNLREPIFAIDKGETSGKFGKSQEYWDNFREAMQNGIGRPVWMPKRDGGEMEGYEIDATMYRVPNEDIPSQVNTLQKMAQKRAIVAVALLAVNASEFFTQDIEDDGASPVVAHQQQSTRVELGDALRAILGAATDGQKQRIEGVRDLLFGTRRKDPNSWTVEELRALRDAAVAISLQSEPEAVTVDKKGKMKDAASRPEGDTTTEPSPAAEAPRTITVAEKEVTEADDPDPFADKDMQRILSGQLRVREFPR